MTILTGFPAGSVISSLSAAATNNLGWALNDTPFRDPDKLGSVDSKTPWLRPRHSVHSFEDKKDSQARLYIPFPNDKAYEQYLSLVPQESRALAELLAIRYGEKKSRTRPRLGYLDFILTQAQEAFAEKVQVHEVGGDGFIAYYFGQRAPVWTYSGALLNTLYDDWYQAFHLLYRDVLRGTRLADLGLTVRLTYAERTIVGSIMNFNTSLSAGAEQAAPFNFQILAHQVIYHQADMSGGQARPGTAGREIARTIDDSEEAEKASADKAVVDALNAADSVLASTLTLRFNDNSEELDPIYEGDFGAYSRATFNVLAKSQEVAESLSLPREQVLAPQRQEAIW